ncbi:response regulator transcription factor [Streptomyces sp. NPDC089919]|uniref:response regulator transcription factor n=1 Tax=Streptomyces sp. NPDC089919 TaxID=3155188 RepID=UPI003441030D
MITVAVVDDDRMLRDGLRSWLAGTDRLRLLATVPTVGALLAAPAADRAPGGPVGAPGAPQEPSGPPDPPADVVLLDLVLGDGSVPEENVRRLRAAGSRVLMISTVTDRERIVATIAAGADGYLTKDQPLEALVEAVEAIAAGGTGHSPELAFAWAYDTGPARPRLAPRELQVLLDYASGLTLKATARRAAISPNTAKYYLDRVKEKYQQAGRPTYTKIDLALRVREDGLADPAP